MSIAIVACPECQAKLKVSGVAAGKKIRCPKCQTSFAVPPEEEEAPRPQSITARAGKAPIRKAPPPDVEDEEEEVLPARKSIKRRPVEEDEDEEDRPAREGVRGRVRDAEEADDDDERPTRKGSRGRDADEEEEDEDRPRRRKTKKQKKARGSPVLLWSLIGGGVLLIGGGVLLVVLLMGGKDDKKGGPNGSDKAATDWPPDPELVKQLGAEVSELGYTFRLPKGFARLQSGPARSGGKQVTWAGTRRQDGTAPVIALNTSPVSPNKSNLSLEELVKQDIASSKAIANVNFSNAEYGRLNGMSFFRARMQASILGKKMSGFVYVTKDGNTLAGIAAMDFEPHQTETLKLLEAAAQTMKKG